MGGLIGQAEDVRTLRGGHFSQIETKNKQIYDIINLNVLGRVVHPTGIWLVYKIGDLYFKTYFAKNQLWFDAITSDPQLIYLRGIEQLYLG